MNEKRGRWLQQTLINTVTDGKPKSHSHQRLYDEHRHRRRPPEQQTCRTCSSAAFAFLASASATSLTWCSAVTACCTCCITSCFWVPSSTPKTLLVDRSIEIHRATDTDRHRLSGHRPSPVKQGEESFHVKFFKVSHPPRIGTWSTMRALLFHLF